MLNNISPYMYMQLPGFFVMRSSDCHALPPPPGKSGTIFFGGIRGLASIWAKLPLLQVILHLSYCRGIYVRGLCLLTLKLHQNPSFRG